MPVLDDNEIQGSRTKTYLSYIDQAVQLGLHPVVPESTQQVVMDIPELFLEQAVNNTPGLAPAEFIAALCQAGRLNQRIPFPTKPELEITSSGFLPDQERYLSQIRPFLMKNQIILAEAATGTGKGRAAAQLAWDQSAYGAVLISAPTVQILLQLISEWFALNPPVKASVTLGKGQFFDPIALENLLVEGLVSDEKTTEIKKWIAEGAEPIPGSGTEPISRIFPETAYLYDDLLHLAPEIGEMRDIMLNEAEGISPAAEVYLAMREHAKNADVVFCTHAMLAYHVLDLRQIVRKEIEELKKTKKGKELLASNNGDLPEKHLQLLLEGYKGKLLRDFRTAIIDEAHLLENGLANAQTSFCSISALRLACLNSSAGTASHRDAVVKQCSKLIELAKDLNGANPGMVFPGTEERHLPHKFQAFLREMGYLEKLLGTCLEYKGKKPKAKPENTFLAEDSLSCEQKLVAMRQALQKALQRKHPIEIDLSPIRKLPSIMAGPTSVKNLLNVLWAMVDTAILTSATLTLPNDKGRPGRDSSWMAGSLNIPQHRRTVTPPVVPSWITSPVTLYIPGVDSLERLAPPSTGNYETAPEETFEGDVDTWRKEVSQVIRGAAADSSGMLILTPSYDDLEGIGAYLRAWMSEEEDRLIIQRRNSSAPLLKKRFLDMATTARRPIWIATGVAWTGMDLGDYVSDLVIPRLPFRLQHTMISKMRHRKWAGSKNETAFMFRQGIGRLVRTPCARSKRLYVLDGRIWLKEGNYYEVFRAILNSYTAIRNI
jgi:CRISPR type IV-associated DEAD/DEAH-box helicase Csf4